MKAKSILALCLVGLATTPLVLGLDPSCNYNGARANPGSPCQCNHPWMGTACDVLDLAPVDKSNWLGLKSIINDQNVSSWGGSVVRDADGMYWMFAAEMGDYCGLNVWLSNSLVVYASSPDPTKVPFKRQGEIEPIFAHEPGAAIAPTGEFVLFYTRAEPPYARPTNNQFLCNGCSNGRSPGSCGVDDSMRNRSINLPTYMTYASHPSGPWSTPQMLPETNVFADSNFAPWINDDGSLLALQRGQVVYSPDWRNISSYRVVSTYPDEGEDPYLWRDKKSGIYHAIVHVHRINTTGLHYFSEDGFAWQPSPGTGNVYTSYVHFTDGTTHNFGCRERPHLIFDANGTVIALTNGASPVHCHLAASPPTALSDDYSWTLLNLMNPPK